MPHPGCRSCVVVAIVQTGVDPFRTPLESCPDRRDQQRRGAREVRLSHAGTLNPGTAPQIATESMLSAQPRGRSERRSITSLSCFATAPPALSRRAFSRLPAVSQACTRVPEVTTPQRPSELVKLPITVRNGHPHFDHYVGTQAKPVSERAHTRCGWPFSTPVAGAGRAYVTPRRPADRSRYSACRGGVAERPNAPVLKTGVLHGTGGSNPSASAQSDQIKQCFLPTSGASDSHSPWTSGSGSGQVCCVDR
jgi:hypothetical protein